MKKMTLYLAALLFGLTARAGLVVSGLQCEQLSDPSGIDIVHPRLSWRLSGEGKDIVETGWQLLVASTPELLARDKGDLWTSPRVADERSRMIVYRGAALKSGMVCYWKVKVWT